MVPTIRACSYTFGQTNALGSEFSVLHATVPSLLNTWTGSGENPSNGSGKV